MMPGAMMTKTRKARRVTRDDLYAMVWRLPMSRLATEFGISGNGLAKICVSIGTQTGPL
jgi:hypothetical protein